MASRRNAFRSIVAGSVVVAALGLSALPAMAVTTVSQQGSVGTWRGMGSAAMCTGAGLWDNDQRQLTVPSYVAVGEATRYGATGQYVYMQQVIERWSGSAWVNYVVVPWERDWIPSTEGVALLTGGQGYNVSPGHYRVRMDFRWYVNGTLVGAVRNYLGPSDFWLFAEASVGGNNSIAWCSI